MQFVASKNLLALCEIQVRVSSFLAGLGTRSMTLSGDGQFGLFNSISKCLAPNGARFTNISGMFAKAGTTPKGRVRTAANNYCFSSGTALPVAGIDICQCGPMGCFLSLNQRVQNDKAGVMGQQAQLSFAFR